MKIATGISTNMECSSEQTNEYKTEMLMLRDMCVRLNASIIFVVCGVWRCQIAFGWYVRAAYTHRIWLWKSAVTEPNHWIISFGAHTAYKYRVSHSVDSITISLSAATVATAAAIAVVVCTSCKFQWQILSALIKHINMCFAKTHSTSSLSNNYPPSLNIQSFHIRWMCGTIQSPIMS